MLPTSKDSKLNSSYLFPGAAAAAASTSGDTSPTPSTPPSSTENGKSQCSSLSDGESYEGYGENESAPRLPNSHDDDLGACGDDNNNLSGRGAGGVELDLAPHAGRNSTPLTDDDLNFIPRDNWRRSSLRRTPISNPESLSQRRWGSMRHCKLVANKLFKQMKRNHEPDERRLDANNQDPLFISSGRRQITTNGLASQLYRSSSFNSSGRSSNCDTAEDMYSDASLEHAHDINYKLELLQRQVTDLADTKNISEDVKTRTKTEYAVLQARYHMLEEQYRDAELRAEERLAEEQRRHRELLARVEREAALQDENCQIKIRTIEIEANALREEAQRLRVLYDKQANDLHRAEEKYELERDQIAVLQQDIDEAKQRERKFEREKKAAEDLMIELSRELERMRSETGPALPTTSLETIRLEELHQELEEMRQRNKSLEEQNEELQAAVLTRGVEEGRHLLNGTMNSLAQELEEMSQTEDSVDTATIASLSQLQQAYQDKEEENTRLKHYIDTILLNIVENYPQLLEVKPVERK